MQFNYVQCFNVNRLYSSSSGAKSDFKHLTLANNTVDNIDLDPEVPTYWATHGLDPFNAYASKLVE